MITIKGLLTSSTLVYGFMFDLKRFRKAEFYENAVSERAMNKVFNNFVALILNLTRSQIL